MPDRILHSICGEITRSLWLMAALTLVMPGCGSKTPAPDEHQAHPPDTHENIGHDSMQAPAAADDISWTMLPTNKTVIARQQVVKPVFSTKEFSITGNGYITFDARRNRKVPVRVGGRVEQLFIKYNYQYVRKGEKILELYSPDLNTYVEEYLYINKQPVDSVLLNKAKQKLFLLGLTPLQIKQIEQHRESSSTISVYSPFEGFILFNPSTQSARSMGPATNSMDGMNGSTGQATSSSSIAASTELSDNSIREGMYVSKDQTLFWINDFREAWGIIAFDKQNEKYIYKGQPVTVISELMPERPYETTLQLIEQVYQGGQKFTQARVYLSNKTGTLKQNSLITASVIVPVRSLTVPASSVYYLGKTAIVWVRINVTKEGSNIFQSRVVKVGHRSNDEVEILDGLQQNEVIAKDAGYLADSETIINY